MKKLSLLTCLMALAVMAFAQVQNGSFETWSGGSPSDWTTIDGGISVSQTSSVVKSGSYAASVTVNTTSQGSTDLRQTISVTSGTTYEFSVWVYHTEGNVRARLYVDGYQNYSDYTTTGEWQQISYSYTPSSSSIEVGLRFYDVSGFDGSEVVYVDDFQPTSTSDGGGSDDNGDDDDDDATCSGTTVTLSLTTDNYGSETSWEILSSGSALYSGSGYSSNSSYSEAYCLADGSYTFVIYDSYGDGICCSHGDGSYALTGNGTTYASGGDFDDEESTSFTIGSGGGNDDDDDDDSGSGGDTDGYYSGTSGLTGSTLKTALYNIIKGHNAQSYGDLWDFYSANEKDTYYENDGTILDIYSENPSGSDSYTFTVISDQCGSYSGEGDCYNREHSFPRSWFGGAVSPMNTDVHHIFPTDGYVNAKRSSYPYGEVSSASYTSDNGSKLGTSGSSGYSGTVFEPIDEFKGDVARAYFYMATRYQNVISSWENNTTYSDAVLDGSSDQVFEDWMLNVLISWHESDPVSDKEEDRNEAAYSFQGNRNPFVDHPEFVEDIWGSVSSRIAASVSEELQEEDVKVYFSEGVLTFKGIEPLSVAVYEVSGKQVFNQSYQANSEISEIPLSLQSNSIYILHVESKDKHVSQLIMAK